MTEINEKINKDTFVKNDANALHGALKTVAMATTSLNALNKMIKDKRDIVKFLEDQEHAYTRLSERIEKALESIGEDPGKISAIKESMLNMSISISTFADDSDSHISDMMIQGSNMGVIEVTKIKNENEEIISKSCISILDDLLNTLDKFVEDMKKFL